MKCWITGNGVKIFLVMRGRCNCYLVSHGNRFLLIDSGWKMNWKALVRNLEKLGVKAGSPVSLVLTHCHFDHAGNAAAFKRAFGAQIVVHKSEEGFLSRGDNPGMGGTLFFSRVLLSIISRSGLFARLGYAAADCDIAVDRGLNLEILGFPGYLVHTPGHSPGSISMIVDDEIALVGDTLFGVFPGSVYPPFAVDPGLMVASWGRLLETGCRIFLPAHGFERSRALLKRQYEKYRKRFDL